MTKHIILFLAANPLGTDRLALDEEARAIHEELERSGHRDKFELVTRWAVRPLDLLRELRKLRPTVVHFSGHGGGGMPPSDMTLQRDRDVVDNSATVEGDHHDGLFFQGSDRRPQFVSTAALQQTFGAAGASVKLVVLNACYSDVQTKALLAHVCCVVGIGGLTRDGTARSFAVGFYGALGDRQSVEVAYRQGCAAISLEGLPDGHRPQLMVRTDADAGRLVLAESEMDKVVGQATDNDTALQVQGWTWYSTVESTDAGVVSVLSLAETLAASAVYAWIAWRFGTLHLTISACVAPLLLLRTERSVSLAFDWFNLMAEMQSDFWDILLELYDWFSDLSEVVTMLPWLGTALSLVFATMETMPILFFCVIPVVIFRISATMMATLKNPLQGILHIPHNWWRCVACIDSLHPLELLPESHKRYGNKYYKTSDMDKEFARFVLAPGRALLEKAIRIRQSQYIYYTIFAIIFLFPAFIYRWSIKGSAVIYGPLIWVAHGSTARTLRVHLRDVIGLAYYRILRWFAAFVLLIFVGKLYIFYSWSDLASSWHNIPGHGLLDAILVPDAFSPWQITISVNAFLTWVLYLLADWAIARWDHGSRINERIVEVALRWLSLVQGFLSIYIILCCIYLAASISGRFNLPTMGTGILPWR